MSDKKGVAHHRYHFRKCLFLLIVRFILKDISNNSFLDTSDFQSIRVHANYLDLNIENNNQDYLNQKPNYLDSFISTSDAFSDTV